MRIALVDGVAVVDEARRLPGRGAWIHPDPDCRRLAATRRSIGRALRAPGVDDSAVVGESA